MEIARKNFLESTKNEKKCQFQRRNYISYGIWFISSDIIDVDVDTVETFKDPGGLKEFLKLVFFICFIPNAGGQIC